MQHLYLIHVVGQGSLFEKQFGRLFLHHPQALGAACALIYD